MRTRGLATAFAAFGAIALASCTTTTLVSVSSANEQGNNYSFGTAIGANGRYVLFNSAATNLVPNDTNNASDAFVRDTVAGTTERVDLSSTGQQLTVVGGGGGGISDDGRYVVFTTNAPNTVPNMPGNLEVFLRDRVAGTTTVVSRAASGDPAHGNSSDLAISPDGRYVLFESTASDLAGHTAPARDSLYRFDRTTGKIAKLATPAKCDTNGFFLSIRGATEAWSTGAIAYSVICDGGSVESGSLYVKMPGQSQRVLDGGGSEGFSISLHWSTDGSLLAYTLYGLSSRSATESAELKLWTGSGTPTTVDTPGGGFSVTTSGNGRYVAYATATDKHPPPLDTYEGTLRVVVLDRSTGTTRLASANVDGAVPNNNSDFPLLSNDGTTVGFSSGATDIVPNDTNGQNDAFVRPVSDVFSATSSRSSLASR